MIRIFSIICFAAASLTIASPCQSQVTFDIEINYTGDQQFLPLFESAEAIWEEILPMWSDGRDAAGNAIVDRLTIDASVGPIDGPFNTLAQAGPRNLRNDGSFIIASAGVMEFDSADVDFLSNGGSFEDVILHEMGHVLGIGTLWAANDLYVNNSGEYTGANGLREYQTEFDPNAAFVPVELDGGPGTANGHWDEGGQQVVDPNNNNFGKTRTQALMTGFISQDMFISNTTGGSLEDLGFVVNYDAIQARAAAVPEPGAASVLAGLTILGLIRRRK